MLILIGIVICLLLTFVYFSMVKIHIAYGKQGENDQGEITIKLFGGLLKRKIKIPTFDFKGLEQGVKVEEFSKSTKEEEKKRAFINKDFIEKIFETYEDWLVHITDLQNKVQWFFARIICERWDWRTTVGTGDAAEAGILTGVVWAVKTNILGFISHYISWDTSPNLEVTPSFQQTVFQTYYEGVFHFRLGDWIRFQIWLWLHLRRNRKKVMKEKSILPI